MFTSLHLTSPTSFARPGCRLLVAGAIASLGFVSPRNAIWTVAALTALVAFFSASQDISIDAYRRELLPDVEQGLGNAVHVNAYKIAALVPGSLALILSDHLPWTTVFVVTAAFMIPGIIMTLVVREPEVHGAPPKNLREAVIEPFREFVQRDGWRGGGLALDDLVIGGGGEEFEVAGARGLAAAMPPCIGGQHHPAPDGARRRIGTHDQALSLGGHGG